MNASSCSMVRAMGLMVRVLRVASPEFSGLEGFATAWPLPLPGRGSGSGCGPRFFGSRCPHPHVHLVDQRGHQILVKRPRGRGVQLLPDKGAGGQVRGKRGRLQRVQLVDAEPIYAPHVRRQLVGAADEQVYERQEFGKALLISSNSSFRKAPMVSPSIRPSAPRNSFLALPYESPRSRRRNGMICKALPFGSA